MLPEIFQNTADNSFLRTKKALNKEQIFLTPNLQDGLFIQNAEDSIVDLIVTILENRRKN